MKCASLSVVLFVVVSCVQSTKLPLPSYLKACNRKTPDLDSCVLNQARTGLSSILKGDRKYGIPSFFPLKISEINLETTGNLVIRLRAVSIYGLDKTNIKRAKIDPVAKQIFLDFTVDALNIIGQYDMDGKILVLPLKGNGDANITAIGGDFQYDLTYKLTTRDGEEYLSVDEQHVDFTLKRLYAYFGNLFNGDPVLGPNTNKVLNDEWEAVLKEVKPAIGDAISTVASSIVNNICNKVPFIQILL